MPIFVSIFIGECEFVLGLGPNWSDLHLLSILMKWHATFLRSLRRKLRLHGGDVIVGEVSQMFCLHKVLKNYFNDHISMLVVRDTIFYFTRGTNAR